MRGVPGCIRRVYTGVCTRVLPVFYVFCCSKRPESTFYRVPHVYRTVSTPLLHPFLTAFAPVSHRFCTVFSLFTACSLFLPRVSCFPLLPRVSSVTACSCFYRMLLLLPHVLVLPHVLPGYRVYLVTACTWLPHVYYYFMFYVRL